MRLPNYEELIKETRSNLALDVMRLESKVAMLSSTLKRINDIADHTDETGNFKEGLALCKGLAEETQEEE